MTVNLKTRPATIKATGADAGSELADGQFRALVAVFGNVDSVGDRIVPGAFTESLKVWEDSGNPIPVIWSHDWMDPFSHIGSVVKAEETEDGLEVVGQLDLEDNPVAKQVYRLMKGRRVQQFSFAYDVKASQAVTEPVEADGNAEDDESDDEKAAEDDVPTRDVLELHTLELFEVGPCLIGVNRETDLRDVKNTRRVLEQAVQAAQADLERRRELTHAGRTSQVRPPRDDAKGPQPIASAPPRLNPASVRALITTYMP
jgi:uncharacterized protein